MTTNASPEYAYAEKEYLLSKSDEEKLAALEKMMSAMPGHKGAESLRADLRSRYKKLKEKIADKEKKRRSTSRKLGIKKEGVQVALIGITQSGKSSLLSVLTNARPEISNHQFVTKQASIGTLSFQGINFQIIDQPAVNYETFDQGIANTADILLIVISSIQDLEILFPFIARATGKRIIVFNKIDSLSEVEKRKIFAYLQSKKYQFSLVSSKTQQGIDELKNRLIENSGVIRIYTKQPGKPHDFNPVILKPGTKVGELARKLFPKQIVVKEIRITGPSSKFPNQQVGIDHELKDKDIVEFRVR